MLKERKTLYTGRIVTLQLDRVVLPNGTECEFEIVKHPGGAAIVALDNDLRVCMLRQYRYAAGDWIWELPAGKLDSGESPRQAAQRELLEEGGVTACQWEDLGSMLSSPGVFTEVIHLFLARDLKQASQSHERHEIIEVHWLPLADACAQALDAGIRDAKTLTGLLRAQGRLDRQVPSLASQTPSLG